MRPRSLLGITVELIETVERPGAYPADARVGRFFRERRYLGSRDRRFVGDATFGWLRFHHRARARWLAWAERRALTVPALPVLADLEHQDAAEPSTAQEAVRRRGHYILDLLAMAADENLPWSLETARAAANELAEDGLGEWHTLVATATAEDGEFLAEADWPHDPVARFACEVSFPEWLARRLLEREGEEEARRLALALNDTAPVDLRVNLRRIDREKTRRRLQQETELTVEPTHFSPLGLRLEGRANLTATTPSKKSWIEVQDEGSQIALLCADASPGMRVIDACAGGGGKTLALADILFREEELPPGGRERPTPGRLWACEIDRRKLGELRRRARDAKVEAFIDYAVIAEDGSLESYLPKAHLVVVDAPCTGLGTIRRNPELKLRHREDDLRRFHEIQLSILERFAPLVRKRGRLVYITCSFLREECEDVVHAFEERHPEFESSPSFFASKCLPSECIEGHEVRLSPVTTRTDAFFIASWRRVVRDGEVEDTED